MPTNSPNPFRECEAWVVVVDGETLPRLNALYWTQVAAFRCADDLYRGYARVQRVRVTAIDEPSET